MALDFAKAAIYVGTYGKYNAGSIRGKWFTLSEYDSRDEFLAAVREFHNDEKDPEFMIQDYEFLPREMAENIFNSDLFWDLAGELDDCEVGAFSAWLECCGVWDLANGTEAADMVESFRDAYMGQYDSEEEYAEEYAEQCMEIPDSLQPYIDYERLARDLFFDLHFLDGYVFAA